MKRNADSCQKKVKVSINKVRSSRCLNSTEAVSVSICRLSSLICGLKLVSALQVTLIQGGEGPGSPAPLPIALCFRQSVCLSGGINKNGNCPQKTNYAHVALKKGFRWNFWMIWTKQWNMKWDMSSCHGTVSGDAYSKLNHIYVLIHL